jgi:hypothetical protein
MEMTANKVLASEYIRPVQKWLVNAVDWIVKDSRKERWEFQGLGVNQKFAGFELISRYSEDFEYGRRVIK